LSKLFNNQLKTLNTKLLPTLEDSTESLSINLELSTDGLHHNKDAKLNLSLDALDNLMPHHHSIMEHAPENGIVSLDS